MQKAYEAHSNWLFRIWTRSIRFGENRRNARQNVCISVHWYSDPRHPCSLASLRFLFACLLVRGKAGINGWCSRLRVSAGVYGKTEWCIGCLAEWCLTVASVPIAQWLTTHGAPPGRWLTIFGVPIAQWLTKNRQTRQCGCQRQTELPVSSFANERPTSPPAQTLTNSECTIPFAHTVLAGSDRVDDAHRVGGKKREWSGKRNLRLARDGNDENNFSYRVECMIFSYFCRVIFSGFV